MGEDENSSLSEEDLISVAFLEVTDNILDEIKNSFLDATTNKWRVYGIFLNRG